MIHRCYVYIVAHYTRSGKRVSLVLLQNRPNFLNRKIHGLASEFVSAIADGLTL